MRALVTIFASIFLAAGSPGQAVECLDRQTLTAARINEFAVLMTAVKLRCKAAGVDFSKSYDAMMQTHRAFFAAADRRLRTFFSDKPRSFDAYSTRLGNRFGGGATDYVNCNRFEKVPRNLAENYDPMNFGRVVYVMVTIPHIDGTECSTP